MILLDIERLRASRRLSRAASDRASGAQGRGRTRLAAGGQVLQLSFDLIHDGRVERRSRKAVHSVDHRLTLSPPASRTPRDLLKTLLAMCEQLSSAASALVTCGPCPGSRVESQPGRCQSSKLA